MKKLIILLTAICITGIVSCTKDDGCGTHNGNELFKGPEGGCYYYNSNGNQTYVDRSECNC